MQAPLSASPAPFAHRWNPRRVFLATLSVVAVVMGFYLMYRFSNILFILFIAAVLATAMRPAVLWLERRHVPQRLGALLIYAALALTVIGMFAALVPLFTEQGSKIVKDVPGYYQQVRTTFRESNSQILRRIGNRLPPEPSLSLLGGTTRQQAAATGDGESVVSQGFGYLGSAVWSLLSLIADFLIAYFWILDHEQIMRAGLLIVPVDGRETAQELWDLAEQKVGAYIRGQALLMLAIGVISTVAFFAVGLPSALVMGVLAGVLEAIPYLGPILTAIMAVVLTLAEAPDKIWWVVGVTIVIQQIENAILVPRIMDRAVGVNALVTLLAIAAFGSLLGLVGAILAIPLAAIIQVLLDHWVLRRDTGTPAAAIEGRDRVAVVRYQAQNLAQDLRERIRPRSSDEDPGYDSFEERIETVVGEIDQLLVQVSTPAAAQTLSAPGGRAL